MDAGVSVITYTSKGGTRVLTASTTAEYAELSETINQLQASGEPDCFWWVVSGGIVEGE